jgi:uncharacterized protein (DUF1810 family)
MNLKKFIDAQEKTYEKALSEIQRGQKKSHWMWYIFPQVKGLGFSETSKFYAIEDLEEAAAFLKDPVLGKRLVQISQALLDLKDLSASQIFGSPDDMKLKSSMTLFSTIDNTHPVFRQVLDKFFKGAMDEKTLSIIGK